MFSHAFRVAILGDLGRLDVLDIRLEVLTTFMAMICNAWYLKVMSQQITCRRRVVAVFEHHPMAQPSTLNDLKAFSMVNGINCKCLI